MASRLEAEAGAPLEMAMDEAIACAARLVTVARRGGRLGLAFGLHPTTGQVMVRQLWSGFPAATSGLAVGDVLLEVNGHASAETVETAMEQCRAGDSIAMRVASLRCIRNVRLCKARGSKFGITFGSSSGVRGRVVIDTLWGSYPAVESGELDTGDEVLSVDGQLVATPEAAHKICCDAVDSVVLRVVSRNMHRPSPLASVGG